MGETCSDTMRTVLLPLLLLLLCVHTSNTMWIHGRDYESYSSRLNSILSPNSELGRFGLPESRLGRVTTLGRVMGHMRRNPNWMLRFKHQPRQTKTSKHRLSSSFPSSKFGFHRDS